MEEPFHWFVEYIVPYLNFLIFLAILIYFARKPLSLLASKRKLAFDAHYKTATDTLNEATKQLDELQKRNKTLDAEIASLKAAALQEAQNEAKRIIEDGKRLANLLIEDAKKMRDAEFFQAQKELEKEALALAKVAVIKKLEKDFDKTKDQKFVEDRLKEMSTLKIAVAGRG